MLWVKCRAVPTFPCMPSWYGKNRMGQNPTYLFNFIGLTSMPPRLYLSHCNYNTCFKYKHTCLLTACCPCYTTRFKQCYKRICICLKSFGVFWASIVFPSCLDGLDVSLEVNYCAFCKEWDKVPAWGLFQTSNGWWKGIE